MRCGVWYIYQHGIFLGIKIRNKTRRNVIHKNGVNKSGEIKASRREFEKKNQTLSAFSLKTSCYINGR